jgi:hypothetical protein
MSVVPVNRGRIEGHTHVGDKEIPKRIVNVQRAGFHGHLHVDFEDGTMRVLQKSEYEHLDLKPGDYYPPMPKIDDPIVEATNASVEGTSGSSTGDGKVQGEDAPLGQQQGASGDQPQAGDSNQPVGSGTEQEEQAQQ